MIRKIPIALIFAALAMPAPAKGAVTTFLDYTGFTARLGELATSAGVTAFSGAEELAIKAGIKSKLEAMYAGFDQTFTEVSPGGTFSTLTFGGTAPPGGLGVADHIDFRNNDLSDVGRTFTANFAFIIDEFTGSTDRATQLSQLTTALAGTAGHEYAHNLGLRHHDAYGTSEYTGPAVATGGSQNDYIMATGSTGLTEVGRETDRTFNDHSLVKLSYADGLLDSTPPTVEEGVGDFPNTVATALELTFTDLSVVDRSAVNVEGFISPEGDMDVFKFDLKAGSTLTVDVNTEIILPGFTPTVDSIIELFDTNGVDVLGTNDDTFYSATTFGSGSFRSLDSILFNVPILADGTYFLKIASFSSAGSGWYNVLLHTDTDEEEPPPPPVIPEPSSMLVYAGLIACCAYGYRRRKRKQNAA